MTAFGGSVPLDSRHIVGFARDFSAVAPGVAQHMHRPTSLTSFPDDLLFNRGLEYSGFYEDGWASGDVYVNLSRPLGGSLRIDGLVPLVDNPMYATELTVRIESREVADRTLGPGDFSLAVPIHDPCSASCAVTLHFSHVQHLHGLNTRPVGALIHSIGFY